MQNLTVTSFIYEQKKYFLYFIFISLLFVFPLIHANLYFLDDLHRIESGLYHWSALGRHLATLSTSVLSLSGFEWLNGGGLADIAPLSQLFSAFFLATASFVFFQYINKTLKITAFWISTLIAVNPFFLSNLLFRYDSLSMSLAVLLITIGFFHHVLWKYNPSISYLFILSVLFLYQPVANLFLAYAGLELLLLSHSNTHLKVIIKRLLTRLFTFFIAYLSYFIITTKFLAKKTTRTEIVAFDIESLHAIKFSLLKFANDAGEFFTISMFLPLLAFVLVVSIALVFSVIKKPLKEMFLKYLLLSLALLIILFSIPGPLIVLKNPASDYRVMVSFYFIFIFFSLIVLLYLPKLRWVAFLPAFIAIAISFQLGNAIKNQRDFDENILGYIHKDILNANLDDNRIYVLGKLPEAPHTKIANNKNNLIKHLNSPSDNWVAASLLREKGLKNTEFLWSTQYKAIRPVLARKMCNHQNQIIIENSIYSIYSSNQEVFILLTENREAFCEKY